MTRRASATRSATDQLAIPDEDDAPGLEPLLNGFSMDGLLDCWCGASDEDKSVADLGLVYGDLCLGDKSDDKQASLVELLESSDRLGLVWPS